MALGEVLRGFDDDGDDVRAAITVAAHERDAMSGELERSSGLRAGGDFHADVAVDSFNVDFSAEGGVDHGDDFFGEDNAAFTGKVLMRFYADEDIEVAFRAAFRSGAALAVEANRHAIVDAGGDFNLKILAVGGDGLRSAENGFLES